MNQMQAFIEKVKNDKDMLAKFNALVASGAGAGEIVALAATYGFTITEEDYRKANEQAGARKSGELAEEDLEAAAGGWTKNKYDPNRCKGLTKKIPDVCGLAFLPCDHYNEEWVRGTSTASGYKQYNFSCNMGAFPQYSEMCRA